MPQAHQDSLRDNGGVAVGANDSCAREAQGDEGDAMDEPETHEGSGLLRHKWL